MAGTLCFSPEKKSHKGERKELFLVRKRRERKTMGK